MHKLHSPVRKSEIPPHQHHRIRGVNIKIGKMWLNNSVNNIEPKYLVQCAMVLWSWPDKVDHQAKARNHERNDEQV